ncbi:hypothetical protein GCM10012279_08010 [Micromonospora yangpuensis]|nr:hypothetical protein GCM10012279_08010 [Micromonospora yangpuensis]
MDQAIGCRSAGASGTFRCAPTAASTIESLDRGFDPRIFADALTQATQLDPDDFAQYSVTGRALDDLRSRFAAWRRELLDDEEG